jgi:hypothetical protein
VLEVGEAAGYVPHQDVAQVDVPPEPQSLEFAALADQQFDGVAMELFAAI